MTHDVMAVHKAPSGTGRTARMNTSHRRAYTTYDPRATDRGAVRVPTHPMHTSSENTGVMPVWTRYTLSQSSTASHVVLAAPSPGSVPVESLITWLTMTPSECSVAANRPASVRPVVRDADSRLGTAADGRAAMAPHATTTSMAAAWNAAPRYRWVASSHTQNTRRQVAAAAADNIAGHHALSAAAACRSRVWTTESMLAMTCATHVTRSAALRAATAPCPSRGGAMRAHQRCTWCVLTLRGPTLAHSAAGAIAARAATVDTVQTNSSMP